MLRSFSAAHNQAAAMNQVKGWDLECNRYYCRYYCSNGTNAMHGRRPSWRIHRRTMIAEEKFHTSGDTDNTPTDS
jgi:hypothetical protein